METFSELLALCAGNSPVTNEFPAQRSMFRSFDVFFDLRLNKPLSKQAQSWWFETPLLTLWRHCNGYRLYGILAIRVRLSISPECDVVFPFVEMHAPLASGIMPMIGGAIRIHSRPLPRWGRDKMAASVHRQLLFLTWSLFFDANLTKIHPQDSS